MQEAVTAFPSQQELTSMLECDREVLAVTGSHAEIIFMDMPIDDPARRNLDITKANTLSEWEPKVSLREGLEMSVGYL